MLTKIKNKLSLPVITGLILSTLDFAFWVWFIIYALISPQAGIFAEDLFGMMIFHMPASMLLPILGSFILSPFITNNSIIPQTIFLFIIGTLQYFFVGYLLGYLVLFFKKKIGKQKDVKKQDINEKLNKL